MNLRYRAEKPYGILLMAALYHFAVYYGGRLIAMDRPPIGMALAVDSQIPFVPSFIIFYCLAYVQWIGGFAYLLYKAPQVCRRAAWASILSETVAFGFFVILPTTLQQPILPEHGGLFVEMVRLIYSCDSPPLNLFPSLHCLMSWLCWRSMREIPGIPGWVNGLHLVFTLLVVASTVLVKQHVLVDLPAGILLAELGFLAAKPLLAAADRRREESLITK